MKISKGKALRLIDDKIAKFETLKATEVLSFGETTYTRNEEYKLVYYAAEANLAELFSEEEVKKFRQQVTVPLWVAINDKTPIAKFRAYNDHIQKCVVLLKAYRERIEHFWADDEDKLSMSPPFGKETVVGKVENTNTMDADTITDVVIITALQKECEAVLRHLGSYQEVRTKGRTFYRASIQSQKSNNSYQVVVLSLTTMGNYRAALATQQAISVWNPSYIILAGIAGGVQKGNSRYLGDLLVGEQIVSYEPGKQTEFGIQRRYEVYRPAKILLEAAKNLPLQEWALATIVPRPDGTTKRVIPQVHFGVVASGEKVVADAALTNELQSDWSQLVGIEMEGVGIATAAYYADYLPGILLVKGMCDWADGFKNDDWQEYAADAAASFVIGLLKSEPFESKLKPQPVRKDEKISSISGKVKISICTKLIKDWEDLADYFDIPDHHRARFVKGREPQSVWEWLSQRDKLSELENGLVFIGRDDLVKILQQHLDDPRWSNRDTALHNTTEGTIEVIKKRQGIQPVALSTKTLKTSGYPLLIPEGEPKFQNNHLNWLDWNTNEQMIMIRNVGSEVALNIASVVYGCESYVVSWATNRRSEQEKNIHWTCWLGVPIAPSERKEAVHKIGNGIFYQKNKHIRQHSFNAPPEPRVVPNQNQPFITARITITYLDISKRKYASIFDYVQHTNGWQLVEFCEDIEEDLNDLKG